MIGMRNAQVCGHARFLGDELRGPLGLDMSASVPIRFISFLLLGTCEALCQQRAGLRLFTSLPDAPSAQVLAQRQLLRNSTSSHFPSAAETLERVQIRWPDGPNANWFETLKTEDVDQHCVDFFGKHVYPALLSRKLSYHPSTSGGLMRRATDAATSIVFTRDSPAGRWNTSYFLGVLSSAMIHTAYRPYWNRPVSAPFSDFGSTIGNDAGMNLLHEFGPGLQQLVKSHAPKFVSRVEQRLGHN